MSSDRDYFSFYLEGREHPIEHPIDVEVLAERVLSGEDIHDVAKAAAKDLAKRHEIDGSQRQWAKKRANREAISVCGGDEATAFRLYLAGVTDSTTHSLEIDILDEVDELMSNGDDADDDEDEEQDDDEPTGD